MDKKKKILIGVGIVAAVILIIAVAIICVALQKKEVPEEKPEPTATAEVTPVPTPEPTATADPHQDQIRSELTGLWVSKKNKNKRPFAIMIANSEEVMPQSGISKASILYEALAEGYTTRMMGIFESSISAKRIGSIRSARHYYVSVADEYDAIFCHYGHTSYALNKISELGVDNLSGLDGTMENVVFYRDSSIPAPHNAFASTKGIAKGIKAKSYRKKHKKSFEGHFKFYENDTDLQEGKDALKVTLGFSPIATCYFEYDAKNKEYKRFEFGKRHTDAVSKKQLTFKNILVQFVEEHNIDKNGYQTINFEDASGKGMYITNGKKVNITWTKSESESKMRYYDKAGNELVLNPGKTYVALYPVYEKDNLKIEKTLKKAKK